MMAILGILRLVPWWVYAAIALVVAFFGWLTVHDHDLKAACDAGWQKKLMVEREAYANALVELKAKQQEVVTKTVIEYRDRVKVVKEKGNDIVHEVQVLVPMDSPLLAGGVRVAHDAAAGGELPADPEGAARAAAPVETAALLTTVAENYTTCREDGERLKALQTLVSRLSQP